MFLSFIFIIDLFYAQDTAARYIVSKEFSYRKLTCVWRVLVVHVARDCHEDDSHGKDSLIHHPAAPDSVANTLLLC